MTTNRNDIYEQVTNEIIQDLEAGHIPWEKPWNGGLELPQNAVTKTIYNGINILILWSKQRRKQYASAKWLTYKQAQELGGQVKKGEKATSIIYYKQLKIDKESENGESETKMIPMIKSHSVFNISQCEGLEILLNEDEKEGEQKNIEPVESAELLVKSSGAKVFHDDVMAFYSPTTDEIHLPKVSAFKDQVSYYGTLLHELTHWTGHTSRLNRNLKKIPNKMERAEEELIAELGSSFLCAQVGLPYTSQHAAYIESWLKNLRNDKKAIFKAAARAKEAADFLNALL